MSEKFGFPVFTVAIIILAGAIRLLELAGAIPSVPWVPIVVITAAILLLGAIALGRDKNRPGFCPYSKLCPFNKFCPLGHGRNEDR